MNLPDLIFKFLIGVCTFIVIKSLYKYNTSLIKRARQFDASGEQDRTLYIDGTISSIHSEPIHLSLFSESIIYYKLFIQEIDPKSEEDEKVFYFSSGTDFVLLDNHTGLSIEVIGSIQLIDSELTKSNILQFQYDENHKSHFQFMKKEFNFHFSKNKLYAILINFIEVGDRVTILGDIGINEGSHCIRTILGQETFVYSGSYHNNISLLRKELFRQVGLSIGLFFLSYIGFLAYHRFFG